MNRIAFTLIGGNNWLGGLNYQVNLITALLDYEQERIQPVLFLGEDVAEAITDRFEGISGLQIVHSEKFNKRQQKQRLIEAMSFGLDTAALKVFRQYRVDVVFEAANFYGWRFPIKSIAWITDLQHQRLRSYFSFFAYWKRELGFQAQVRSGRHIMLSSNAAVEDFKNYYSVDTTQLHVVRFSVPVKITPFERAALLRKYNLPENFFYLPNQFWRHKNHEVVCRAIALAKQSGYDVTIVMTGNTEDPRDPQHFTNLKKLVKDLDVEQNFRVLGMVPYVDVQALMLSCNAFINPSKFEGWSTTVEEAKALGIRMLLSDLTVHHEQADDIAEFFAADEPFQLAELLCRFHAEPPQSFKYDDEKISQISKQKMMYFAEEFADMVNLVCDS